MKTIEEVQALVMAYHKPTEYRGQFYDNLFGYKIKETQYFWTSHDENLLMTINRELFKFKGDILPFSKYDDAVFVLFIEKEILSIL